LAKPNPRALPGLTLTKTLSVSRGRGKELKTKKETEKQVNGGVAEQEISFFIILKLRKGRVHSFILI
jgi:hypothetical protein